MVALVGCAWIWLGALGCLDRCLELRCGARSLVESSSSSWRLSSRSCNRVRDQGFRAQFIRCIGSEIFLISRRRFLEQTTRVAGSAVLADSVLAGVSLAGGMPVPDTKQ